MNADDKLLTVKEAAARLRVHPETLRGWIREREVPHQRYGPHGLIRLRWADLFPNSEKSSTPLRAFETFRRIQRKDKGSAEVCGP